MKKVAAVKAAAAYLYCTVLSLFCTVAQWGTYSTIRYKVSPTPFCEPMSVLVIQIKSRVRAILPSLGGGGVPFAHLAENEVQSLFGKRS